MPGWHGSRPLTGAYIISETLTLGQLLLFLPPFIVGYYSAMQTGENRRVPGILFGALAGIVTGIILAGLLLLGNAVNLRRCLSMPRPSYGIS